MARFREKPAIVNAAIVMAAKLNARGCCLLTRRMMYKWQMNPTTTTQHSVDPAGVAEIAFQLCRQNRRAWSFEVEARPYVET